MSLTTREKINVVGPALRALGAAGDVLKLVRFQSGGKPPTGAVSVELPKGPAEPAQIVDALRGLVQPGGAVPKAVAVKGLGTFRLAEPSAASGRAAGKVAFVTGAAQGIGLEISQDLVAEGAYVVLADINEAGARTAAAELVNRHGPNRAVAVKVDVTDEGSVADAASFVVDQFGGLDLLVSNAGVLKAGSVKAQPVADFDLVTAVNYRGYFLCVQKFAPIMAVQHRAKDDCWSDIIQINSKSGLIGSNRNSAYAGSKFGGIGLTQSFALELVTDGVKVNSICPGNFFDGPLWSDPKTGLFVQYLRTGKVPGAKTVEEVRKAYEAKVPMGRGCTIVDVMKAVYYLMAQKYETGQALPVTGGQVMLR